MKVLKARRRNAKASPKFCINRRSIFVRQSRRFEESQPPTCRICMVDGPAKAFSSSGDDTTFGLTLPKPPPVRDDRATKRRRTPKSSPMLKRAADCVFDPIDRSTAISALPAEPSLATCPKPHRVLANTTVEITRRPLLARRCRKSSALRPAGALFDPTTRTNNGCRCSTGYQTVLTHFTGDDEACEIFIELMSTRARSRFRLDTGRSPRRGDESIRTRLPRPTCLSTALDVNCLRQLA